MKDQTAKRTLAVTTPTDSAFARARTRQFIFLGVFVIAVAAAAVGVRTLSPAKKIVPPPFVPANAYTPAEGTVYQVLVAPGEQVRKGQLLAVLDPRPYEQQLSLAEADLIAAEHQSQPSDIAVAAPPTMPGALPMAGGFEKVPVPVPGTVAPLNPLPNASPNRSSVGVPPAKAPTSSTEAKLKGLKEKRAKAEALLNDSKSKVEAAKAEAVSSATLLQSAEAITVKAKAAKDKSASLLATGAISANEASKSESYYNQVMGQYQAAKLKAAEAQALAGQLDRDISEAEATLKTIDSDISKAQAAAAEEKKHPAAPANEIVVTPPPAAEPARPKYKLVPVKPPSLGPVAPAPVQVNFGPSPDALKAIAKARAGVEMASKAFARCVIYAPASGTVREVNIRPGEKVGAKQLSIVIAKQR